MATNYTLAQAIKIMHEGKDTEAIIEITRRFPQLALLANTILTKAGEEFVKLTSAFPEWMTANKMNGLLKKAAEGSIDGGEDEPAEEAPETEKENDEKPRRRRGKDKEEEAADNDEAAEDETESDDPYAGKSAMDLFKECKKRKIKVEPKKPAKFYADLLKKDDAAKAKAKAKTEEADDDWGDEEEVEEKKPAKKAGKKPDKKEEEDDEDWDI